MGQQARGNIYANVIPPQERNLCKTGGCHDVPHSAHVHARVDGRAQGVHVDLYQEIYVQRTTLEQEAHSYPPLALEGTSAYVRHPAQAPRRRAPQCVAASSS